MNLQPRQPPPAATLGTRVPAQDYEKLRRQCLQQNKLFEDPYFPANDSSLFFSQEIPFKPEWKRPGVRRKEGRKGVYPSWCMRSVLFTCDFCG